MKFKINRKAFIKDLKVLEGFSTAIAITVSDAVVVEAVGAKIGVKYLPASLEAIERGEMFVSISVFESLLKSIDAKELYCDGISLEFGTARLNFKTLSDVVRWERPKDTTELFTLSASEMSRLIVQGTSAAAGRPAEFPKYVGASLLQLEASAVKLVSTDGKRLSLAKSACGTATIRDLTLYSKDLNSVVSLLGGDDGEVKVSSATDCAFFDYGHATIWLRMVDECAFLRYERILTDKFVVSVTLDRKVLMSILKQQTAFVKGSRPVLATYLYLRPGADLKLACVSNAKGDLEVRSDVMSAVITGDPLVVCFDLRYLQDGLKVIEADEVRIDFAGDESQCQIYSDESLAYIYMLMPVRKAPNDLRAIEESEKKSGSKGTEAEADGNKEA